MPEFVRREIRDENLKFAHNRHLFDPNHWQFVQNLCQLGLSIEQQPNYEPLSFGLGQNNDKLGLSPNSRLEFGSCAAQFAMSFLFDLAWHCKKSCRAEQANQILAWLEQSNKNHQNSTIVDFLTVNFDYCKEYLLQCPNLEVRQDFCRFLVASLLPNVASLQNGELVRNLLRMVSRGDVAEYWQNANGVFELFAEISERSKDVLRLLLENDCFSILWAFIVQPTSQVDISYNNLF